MKSNENQKLSPRQMQVLPALLTSPSYEEAARRSAISAKQVHQWLQDPFFRKILDQYRNELFRNSLASLKAGTQKAVQTLLSLIEHEDPRISLVASEKVLINALKAIELLEFDDRISALEIMFEKLSQKTEDPLNEKMLG